MSLNVHEVRQMAILGYRSEIAKMSTELLRLEAIERAEQLVIPPEISEVPKRKKRKLSAKGRRAIIAARKRYWKEYHRRNKGKRAA